MPTVSIIDRGCRGCTMCVDICPVEVFDYDEAQELARVSRDKDCIGCLSCAYVCPSQCVEVADYEELRPFHRIEGHAQLVERFLQHKTAAATLTETDIEEARLDVAARLLALSKTVVETIGRGHRAVGRRSGAVAATHLPEGYEQTGVEGVLAGMQRMLGAAFNVGFEVSGSEVGLTFAPCGLCRVVEDAGETVGEAVLCEIFHEYWAGLLTAYIGETYRYEMPRTGATCHMRLFPAR